MKFDIRRTSNRSDVEGSIEINTIEELIKYLNETKYELILGSSDRYINSITEEHKPKEIYFIEIYDDYRE